MPKKTDKQLLDEALAAQAAGTYVDPVETAKTFLGKDTVVDDANRWGQSASAATREAAKLTPLGATRRYGAPVVGAAKAAAIPASFLGGPVGMIAGGALAVEGLNAAVKDPSVTNVGMAGLGALPFMRLAKGVRGATKTADTVGEVDRFMPNKPGATGPPRGVEIPKPGGTPYQRPTPYTPADPYMANTSAKVSAPRAGDAADTTPSVTAMVDRYLPNQPGILEDMVRETMTKPVGPRGLGLVDEGVPNNPVALELEAGRQADLAEHLATRVPRGVSGDEFAGVQPYGPSTKLTPEEALMEDEFWETFIRNYR